MYNPSREIELLKFWKENEIFEKSLKQTKEGEPFVFYDGPPFATGLPHVGHVLPSTLKDIVPRYQTMKGRFVSRKWGWDCHGLPIENLVEKELNLKTKKDILDLGIEKFNRTARESVLRYADEWREIVPRLGRWVDMTDDYRTMDASYTEKVWNVFSRLNDKGLVYESFKVMYVCPRCETSLSNFEVNQGYKDITDISVYVKFSVDGAHLLAWTTTPWTLAGNMALAVGKDITYVKVKVDSDIIILSKNRVYHVLKDKDYEILEEIKGSDLAGKSYEPVFDTYKDADFENKSNAWKVYCADFVTDEDGTGIVHIAPGFGEDDLKLAKIEKIPFVQHVAIDGKFKEEVKDFRGEDVKPKEDHQKTDIEIIKFLAKQEALFKKEKIIHSYPHCWRCSTPLLNFATSSWFVRVTELKDKLVEENKKVKWIPREIGENRFGKWLEGARDWAVSRARFWGAPIPVWKSDDGKVIDFVSSLTDLKKKIKRNDYVVLRHGEAEHNVKGIMSSDINDGMHLTEKGKNDVKNSAKEIAVGVDLIFVSPLQRTRETANLAAEVLNFKGEIIVDERLRELECGDFNLKPYSDYVDYLTGLHKDWLFEVAIPGGEGYKDLRNRISDFIYDIDSKYEGKRILIVTHEAGVKMLKAVADGGQKEDIQKCWTEMKVETGTQRELEFSSLPKNEKNEVDLHRPYIDEIVIKKDGVMLKRVTDVFDCWFESGSMPFASNQAGYPADYIAEGLDQTRGWFYSLLVLGVALENKSPYKNVLVNGLVLAEDGRKMSKSLNNYPPLLPTLEKYGVDSLRYFLLSSPSVKSEDTAFSEKNLDEIVKKHFNRLYNIVSLYEMYKSDASDLNVESSNVLDLWVKALLKKTAKTMTNHLDNYEFDKATRLIGEFIENLSTWYIRRSRDRFKGEDIQKRNEALSTTAWVLIEFSKLCAPFLPFLAEDIYQKITMGVFVNKESVHLEEWPSYGDIDEDLILEMAEVRKVVSLALEARAKGSMKVRQPLSRLMIRTDERDIATNEDYLELIKDEVNVKEVILNSEIEDDVMLDITLTPELIDEGVVRELVRFIQEQRKNAGLSPKDTIILNVNTKEDGKLLIQKYKDEISSTARIADIIFEDNDGEKLEAEDYEFKVLIKKI